MKDKTQNYTNVQTVAMVEAYTAADGDMERAAVVAEYAEEYGKSPASIRAKLVSEGVYVAKTYKTKTGAKAESKEQIVDSIAKVLDVASDRLTGLEKANKTTLKLIRSALEARS